MENLEVGDVVLCTVDKIVGTIVFVNIDKTGQEGSIVLSEIAPGRIRNLRDYVVPKKKIVCKILRMQDNRIHLSLRRVTQKEEKEAKEEFKQEQNSQGILKGILKEKAKEIIEKINKETGVYEFLQESKENSERLEKLVGKEDAEKITSILNNQKQKKVSIKREIKLTTNDPNGLDQIKEIFEGLKDIEVRYISAGRYSIKKESNELKKADNELKKILEEIEKKAKREHMDFAVKEK